MPSAKSGNAGTPVSPADPEKAQEADVAEPGEVEELKKDQLVTKSGKFGALKFKTAKKPGDEEEAKLKSSWIEIELIGEDDSPVIGESYRVILADGTAVEGTLDEKGLARIEGIEPGTCKVTFPRLDSDAWEKI